MNRGTSYGSNYLLRTDRVPGEEPLPYVKFGKQTWITVVVIAVHAALVVVPFVFVLGVCLLLYFFPVCHCGKATQELPSFF